MKKLLYSLLILIGFQLQAQVSIDEALDFTGKTPDGATIELFSHLDAGQHVMIYFFSDGCYTCHEYAPSMDTIYDLYGQNEGDLYVMAINKDIGNPEMIEFANAYNWEFPYLSGLEGNGQYILYDLYGVGMTPTTVIIKPDKSIPWDIIFPARVDTLQKYLTMSGVFPTSVEEISSSSNLNIFPNPTSDFLKIESTYPIFNLRIFNAIGKEMFNEQKLNMSYTIKVQSWDSGIYFVRMEDEFGVNYQKFIVK